MVVVKDMTDLTRRQKEVLRYITRYQKRKGYAPSIRDICKGVKLSSSSTVHLHLTSLEEKGYIKRDSTKPRTIEILDRAEAVLNEKEDSPSSGELLHEMADDYSGALSENPESGLPEMRREADAAGMEVPDNHEYLEYQERIEEDMFKRTSSSTFQDTIPGMNFINCPPYQGV